jgi:CheY-like chemotaxis protein
MLPTIAIVDDDEGHSYLIRENLESAGLLNRIESFRDGQEFLDFMFMRGEGRKRQSGLNYLVLLDIRMPKVDGVEVLRQIKADPELRKLPVIMLTTTDDAREVDRCHLLGCSGYVQKPVDYDRFSKAIRNMALFLPLLLVPKVDGIAV